MGAGAAAGGERRAAAGGERIGTGVAADRGFAAEMIRPDAGGGDPGHIIGKNYNIIVQTMISYFLTFQMFPIPSDGAASVDFI